MLALGLLDVNKQELADWLDWAGRPDDATKASLAVCP